MVRALISLLLICTGCFKTVHWTTTTAGGELTISCMTACVAEHRSPETCAERCPDVVVGDGRCSAAVEDHPDLTCGEGTDARDGVRAAAIIGILAVLGGVVIQSETASDTQPLLD